jgi:hypothetical protein
MALKCIFYRKSEAGCPERQVKLNTTKIKYPFVSREKVDIL